MAGCIYQHIICISIFPKEIENEIEIALKYVGDLIMPQTSHEREREREMEREKD